MKNKEQLDEQVLNMSIIPLLTYLSENTYSCVHINSDEVFSKILKKPSIVQKKMIPCNKTFGLFDKVKLKKYFF